MQHNNFACSIIYMMKLILALYIDVMVLAGYGQPMHSISIFPSIFIKTSDVSLFLWTQYHNSVWKIFDFCIIHNFFVSYYKVELGHTWSQVLQWIKAVSLMLLLKLMCILMLIIRYCGVNWIFFGYKDYSCFWVKFMQLSFCIYIF